MWIKAILFAALCLPSLRSLAQPRIISYQGEIATSSGIPLADGGHTISVTIYDKPAGGSPLFTEIHQTDVRSGVFGIAIGSVEPLPATMPFERELFLGISVDGGAELEPRTAILSVPTSLYAATAGEALRLSPTASGVVTSVNEMSGSLRIVGDSSLVVTQTGNTIKLHAVPGGSRGLELLSSPEQTIRLVSPAGPNAAIDVADGAISTKKLADAAVTGNKIARGGATNGQALKWNGSTWAPANDVGGTPISTMMPIIGDGGTANPISILQANATTGGFLSPTDWNTFNNKLGRVATTIRFGGDGTAANPIELARQGALAGQVLKWNGSSWAPGDIASGLSTVVANAPLSGNGTSTNPLTIRQANSATNGYLSSTDWTTFNNKLSSVAVAARLTGDGTLANPIDIARQGATPGQTLKWNGSSWTPADDATGLPSVSVRSPELSGNGTSSDPIVLAQQSAASGQILKWNGTSWSPANDLSGLGSVSVRSPELSGTGTTSDPIVLAQQSAVSGEVLKWNGASWSPASDNGLATVAVNSPITGNGTTTSPLSMPQASGSTNGYLTSADWTTFNTKLSSVAVTARLTGNGTSANPLDIAQQGAASGQVLKWDGSSWSPANDNGGLSSVTTDATLGGDGTTGNPLRIAQQGATSGQVLKWSGSTWLPSSDNGGLSTVSVRSPELAGSGTTADPVYLAQQGATSGQVLKWNGTSWSPATDNGLSTVSVRSPELAGSGTTADPIVLAQQGAVSGQVLKWNGTSWSPGQDERGLTSVVVSAPLTGNGTTESPITMPQANANTNGYLTSTDWTTFNNKLSAVSVTARLSGNGTTANPLDIAQQGATSGQALKWNGSAWAPADDEGGSSLTDATLDGDGTSGDVLKIAQQGATGGQVLKWNGSTWLPSDDNSGLTSVSVTPRLTGNGTSANPLEIAQQGATSGQALKWNGSTWSPANDNGGLSSVSVNVPITGDGTSANPLTMAQANATTSGYLSSGDWNTFNNKLSSVAVTLRLTGNGTTSTPLDIAQQGASSGQVLKWNGTAWSPGNDNTGSIPNGTVANSTLRWDGSAWVENVNVLSSAAGKITANAGINLNGSSSPLETGGSAGTSGYVLTSQGAGNTPAWRDINTLVTAWGLTGNSGTTPGANFLGTTDNRAFEIHVYDGDAASRGSKRVMRYEPNATSANIIGGFQGNTVGSGIVGATISGGGGSGVATNQITDHWGTIGGGNANLVSGMHGVIAGGGGNTSSGTKSAIGGGGGNVASALSSAIAGGDNNTASGIYSAIGGGLDNTAGEASAIPGGKHLNLGTNSFGYNGSNSTTVVNLSGESNKAYFGNVDMMIGNVDNTARALRFYEPNSSFTYSGTNYTSFKAGTQSANIDYTLPVSAPAQNGAVMLASTTGTMSWSSNLAWDGSNSRLAVNTSSANTTVDVNGDVAIREHSITLANGNNNNVNVGAYSFIRITGPTSGFTITGIAGGQNGKTLVVFNNSGQAMTINHNDANSNAGSRILTRNGAAYSTAAGSNFDVVTMIYSAANSAWIITSTY